MRSTNQASMMHVCALKILSSPRSAFPPTKVVLLTVIMFVLYFECFYAQSILILFKNLIKWINCEQLDKD